MKRASSIAAAAARPLQRGRILRASRLVLCAILVAAFQFAGLARAEDPAASATRIGNGAFAILDALNARSGIKSNETVGAVAIFAGDAQSLSHTLAIGDRVRASSALATLESDRDAVDSAIASNPGLVNAADWNRIKSEMAALANQIVPTGAARHEAASAAKPAATATSSVSPRAVEPPATAAIPTEPPVPRGTAKADARPPRVVIESRTAEGADVRLKGYIEGTDLKRGGIYLGKHQLHAFDVAGVAGEHRINFDIGLASPAPGTVIRVYDVAGRMAEAPIAAASIAADSAESAAASESPPPDRADASDAPEIPPLSSAAHVPADEAPTTEHGVEVFRGNRKGESGVGGSNIAEIPSRATVRRSPSRRHPMSSQLGNVRVTITAENLLAAVPPTYQLAGQIQGHGISRAGIYVDRRLVKPIAVEFGSDVTNFDVQFTTNGGEVTIRAYSVGNQYVESSVDLSTAMASAGMPEGPSMIPGGAILGGPMSSGILIQIQGVGPITRNLYLVSGLISGRSLSSAGLYQNGMLVQRIPIGGGGIAGAIGAFISGGSRNVNFNVRFNPQAGPATIRAFDSRGAYSEQPVIVAGMSPYGGINPYGMNPYGANPYGSYGSGISPYGRNPNPYADGKLGAPPVSPYLPPTNPFASPPASSW